MIWQDLLKNLQQQKQTHQELLKLLQQEEKQPIHLSIKELESLNLDRKIQIEKLQNLESKRKELIKAHFQEVSFETESLQTILSYCENKELRQKLSKSRKELNELLTKIQIQNKRNEIIIRSRRFATHTLYEDLKSRLKSKTLYSEKGKTLSTSPSNMIQRWV